MLHSIRWRIAIPYVLLILVLMIGISVFLSRIVRQSTLDNLKNQLLSQARLIVNDLQPDFVGASNDLNLDNQAKALADLIRARVTLIAADGTVIGESHDDRTRMDNHANRDEIIQAKAVGSGSSIRFSHTEGYDMLYAALPVTDAAGVVGFVRLAVPLQEIQGELRQIQQTIVLISLLAAGMAILLAFWLANQTTRPLRELTQAANRIASGDLSLHILQTTSDEVGQLTKAFNVMGAKLRSEIDALESERSKLSAVLSEMSDGVLILDQAGHIQLINPAAETLFEVSHTEAMGRSLIEALRQYQLVELWKKCLETGEPQAVLIEIPFSRRYLQCVATNLGQALPGSTLLLIQNLTRLRHLETVRQDFMSNISHELRTPLASLKALTETLQETALDDPPAAKRFLQQMETEVDALSLIVLELLELSRIESGRVPLKLEPFSPMILIDQAVERLGLQAERANLTVITNCQPDIPPVLADPTRLEQVLVNLLHNAIKFTQSGGIIEIGCVLDGEKVRFSVRDNGIGIPADDLPRIFERFYKTDRARSGGGTGLGLAISKHLVEAHGGQIWAESEVGRGSVFFFSIPFAT